MVAMGKSWQNYRSVLNDNAAIFSVNLDMAEKFANNDKPSIIQFSIPYEGESDGLPNYETYQQHFPFFVELLTQLSTIKSALYAGHVISNGCTTCYFYTNDANQFRAMLQQFNLFSVNVQKDPQWDIYFGFLLPSPLEIKINYTEDTLNTMLQYGKDLSKHYFLQHIFQFYSEQSMQYFMEACNLHADFEIKYVQKAVAIDNLEKKKIFIVTLQHEITLDTQEIFTLIENFEQQATKFYGHYNGWECNELSRLTKALH